MLCEEVVKRSVYLSLGVAFLLTACQQHAPTVYIAGSFFPAWLICIVFGVVGALVVRLISIKTGFEDILPLRLFFYVSVALIIAMIIGYFGFAS